MRSRMTAGMQLGARIQQSDDEARPIHLPNFVLVQGWSRRAVANELKSKSEWALWSYETASEYRHARRQSSDEYTQSFCS
jgi:hypothetical protein